jgi:Protein of unknown function (DUF2993).
MVNKNKSVLKLIGVIVVALILIAVIIGQIVIPPIVKDKLYEAIVVMLPEAKDIVVDVKATPSLKMAFGKFDYVNVSAKDFLFKDIPITSLEVKADDVTIKLGSIDANSPFGDADIRLAMTTDDVISSLISKTLDQNIIDVRFEDNQLVASGEIVILGVSIGVETYGKLVVQSSNVVSFDIQQVHLADREVNDLIVSLVKSLINIQFNLGELPFDMRLTSIEIDKNVVVFTGGMGR